MLWDLFSSGLWVEEEEKLQWVLQVTYYCSDREVANFVSPKLTSFVQLEHLEGLL